MLANSVNTPTMQKAVDVIEQMRKDELMQERARERWLTIVNERMEKAAVREDEQAAMIESMKEEGLSEQQITAILNRRNKKKRT